MLVKTLASEEKLNLLAETIQSAVEVWKWCCTSTTHQKYTKKRPKGRFLVVGIGFEPMTSGL